jgi:TPP-dependent pyruvate/acetoin dehydrogenase alpha subunit
MRSWPSTTSVTRRRWRTCSSSTRYSGRWAKRSRPTERRDPIQNLRKRLALTETEWSLLDADAHKVVEASVEFAQAGTDPNPADALKYVYAEP